MGATPTGIEGPLVEPGSDAWLATMSASKIAAVVGLSPFESRFSTWHRMAGHLADEDNEILASGRYLEPAIANWFADQHPDWVVTRTGTWTHRDHAMQTASPDRMLWLPDDEQRLLECKRALSDDEWGEPFTDQIPPYYRAQVLWQLDTTGLDVCHVAMITVFLEFREYVVEANPAEAAELRAHAVDFLGTLERGDQPSIDEHTATYQAIRTLHPEIDGDTVEVDGHLASRFVRTAANKKAAEDAHRLSTSLVAEAMGTAKKAVCGDHTIATRQARGDGKPYVVAGRSLPDPSVFHHPTHPETEAA